MKTYDEAPNYDLFPAEDLPAPTKDLPTPVSEAEKKMTPSEFAAYLKNQRGTSKTKGPSEAEQEVIGYK